MNALDEGAIRDAESATSQIARVERNVSSSNPPNGDYGTPTEDECRSDGSTKDSPEAHDLEDSDNESSVLLNNAVYQPPQRKTRTKEDRAAAVGHKRGNPGRFFGEQYDYLDNLLPAFRNIPVEETAKGPVKRPEDLKRFMGSATGGFWKRFPWKSVRKDMGKGSENLSREDVIQATNATILHWYRYRANPKTKELDAWDEVLKPLRKAPGRAPKRLPAWQQWMTHNGEAIEQEAIRIHGEPKDTGGKKNKEGKRSFPLAIQTKIAQTLYAALSDDAKAKTELEVTERYEAKLAEYKSGELGEPSDDPEVQAEARRRLEVVVEPLLKLIGKHTGSSAVCLILGSRSKNPGQWDVRSVNWGKSNEIVPRIFSEWDAPFFARFVQVFTQFCGSTPGGDEEHWLDPLPGTTEVDLVGGQAEEAGEGSNSGENGRRSDDAVEGSAEGASEEGPDADEVSAPMPVLRADACEELRDRIMALEEDDRRTQTNMVNSHNDFEMERENAMAKNEVVLRSTLAGYDLGIGPQTKTKRSQKPKPKPKPKKPDPAKQRATCQLTKHTAMSHQPHDLSPPLETMQLLPSNVASISPDGIAHVPSSALHGPPSRSEGLTLPAPGNVLVASQNIHDVAERRMLSSATDSAVAGPGAVSPPATSAERPAGRTSLSPNARLTQLPPTPKPPTMLNVAPNAQEHACHVANDKRATTSVSREGWPGWLCAHYDHLSRSHVVNDIIGEEYEIEWMSMLNRWVALERALYFANPKSSFPAAGKPKDVTAWVRGGRKGDITVKQDDFCTNAEQWWDSINPSWRKRLNGKLVMGGTGDWSPIIVSGQNGFVNIITMLVAMRKLQDEEAWEDMLRDVAWVLKGALGQKQAETLKRKAIVDVRDEAETHASKRRRRR